MAWATKTEANAYAVKWYHANKDRLRARPGHVERIRENKRKYREANRELILAKGRVRHLKRKYGMLPEEKTALLVSQGGKCGNLGCGRTEPGGGGVWHVDHCHTTGKVRGILCHGCNLSLGNLDDSPERIKGLVSYLERAA